MAVDLSPSPAAGLLVELAAGIDALYLSGRASVPVRVLDSLAAAKAEAQEVGAPVVFVFGGEEFQVSPGSWGKYAYRLAHRDGLVGVTRSEALPALRFQPRAELLHSLGPRTAVEMFRDVCEAEVGPVRVSVSRVDVFADWQGWALHRSMAGRFLSRSKNRTTYEVGDVCTGFGFGFGRGSKAAFSARVYDKTVEVAGSGHDWWFDVWGSRLDPDRPVHRVEFQVERKGVRDLQMDTPDEVFDGIGDVWRYCTHEWLTYRTSTRDGTSARWPLAPEWEDVQRASLMQRQVGLARLKEGERSGALRLLMPLLNGCVAGFGAHLDCHGIGDTVALLPEYLRSYEETSNTLFAQRMAEKRRGWAT